MNRVGVNWNPVSLNSVSWTWFLCRKASLCGFGKHLFLLTHVLSWYETALFPFFIFVVHTHVLNYKCDLLSYILMEDFSGDSLFLQCKNLAAYHYKDRAHSSKVLMLSPIKTSSQDYLHCMITLECSVEYILKLLMKYIMIIDCN